MSVNPPRSVWEEMSWRRPPAWRTQCVFSNAFSYVRDDLMYTLWSPAQQASPFASGRTREGKLDTRAEIRRCSSSEEKC
jgi:hypothetical protein